MHKSRHEQIWQKYNSAKVARGQLICDLLRCFIRLENKTILDVGCGFGGAAIAIAKAGAEVVAIDIDAQRLHSVREAIKAAKVPVDVRQVAIEDLPLTEQYHAIIIWDVLEHISSPATILKRLYRLLKEKGLLLIATPNRLSPINALCDPHYGLPLLAMLRRQQVKKIIVDLLGWHSQQKTDFPQLLTLKQLSTQLQSAGFSWQFIHRAVLRLALQNPEALWIRPWHVSIFKNLNKISNNTWLFSLLSNDITIITRIWLPTFFILGQKR